MILILMVEAPPCTPVSLTVCRRRSPPLPPPPSRSRSSPPQRGSTPSGSEAPSWLLCPPSSRCGSPSRSTTSAAHPLSTASASKSCSISCLQPLLLEMDHVIKSITGFSYTFQTEDNKILSIVEMNNMTCYVLL